VKKGDEEEALALTYLQQQGLKLVLRNYRARGGELDLVMRDGATLAVVEVRKRAHRGFGSAAESVDAHKRGRIVLATRWLLAARADLAKLPVRFDVVTLDADNRLDWIRSAFDADA
jgi:putative endonuclease